MSHKKSITLFLLGLMVIWNGSSLEAQTLESFFPKDIPDGWVLIEGPRIYTKKTLFEHINGQAELFFKYGFHRSVFAIYQNSKNPNHQIEIDIYDMGKVLHAFGIFSRFRGKDLTLGVGLDSSLDDQSALFYKGKYFVMVYSTETNPLILKEFSKGIALKIIDRSPPPKEISYFPKPGLLHGSIQYYTEGLLGYQFLKQGFQGTYIEKVAAKVENKEFRLFIAIFKNSQEAMNTLKVYKETISEKGNPFLGNLIQFGTRALKGEDPYHGRVILLQKGFYLIGATGFEKEAYAESLLTELMRNIR